MRGRSIPAWAGETPSVAGVIDRLRVYPRVGGGNLTAGIVYLADKGLSPRGRGKLCASEAKVPAMRSIPAWAGETI